jgi:hypothetical protein
MNKISIALFGRRSNAESFQKRLSDAGISAQVHDVMGTTGARLEVPADQFERAHELMLNWDANESGVPGAIRCPECRSLRVEYPQYSHKSILPNLLVGFLANIGAMRKEFYCQDCHFTWPKEGTKPSSARPHMAPYYFIEGVPQPQPHQGRQPSHAGT